MPPATKTPLTPARVIAGAVSLADQIGVDALTIRKLATALSVKPMTIYHHVANRDAIIDGMVDAVFGEIHKPPSDEHWRTAMVERATSMRSAMLRHAWAPPLMESRTMPGPETLGHHDAVLGCLRGNGFSVRMTAHAYALIDAFIYGFTLQEATLPATEGAEMVALAESITATFADGAYPHLLEFTADHIMQPGYDFGAEFEFGLNLILDGLEDALL